MTRHPRLCLVVACWLLAGTPGDTLVAWDQRGAASISGVVVDASSGDPIRRVTVVATEQGAAAAARVAVTTDDGRFAFRNLATGRHLVTATKASYLTTAYGATRLMSPGVSPTGTAIALRDGEQKTSVTLRLTRGGVITGTVRDSSAAPVRGVRVSVIAWRRSPASGEPVATTVPSISPTTDPRGEYRIYGLPPGEYFVLARPATGVPNDFEQTQAADVRRVLDRPTALLASPSQIPAAPRPAADPPRRPTYGYAAVFHPGTTSLPMAARVVIGAGEERAGVDITLHIVPQSRLSGRLVGPDGRPAAGLPVMVRDATTGPATTSRFAVTDADGRYSLPAIPPGPYVLTVSGGQGRPDMPPPVWGRAEVTISPGDDATLDVALQPSLTVTGQVRLESTAGGDAVDLTGARVALRSRSGGQVSVTAAADGRFTLNGLVPDAYRWMVSLPAATPWLLKSGLIGNREAVDQFVEISEDVKDATVVLTPHVSEVAGVIQDAGGQPAPEYFLVIFPSDRVLWTWQSRRIQQARPSSDGQFLFRNLPPGDYLLGAVTDLEPLMIYDPSFLSELLSVSVQVRLAEGEKKRQDIRLRLPAEVAAARTDVEPPASHKGDLDVMPSVGLHAGRPVTKDVTLAEDLDDLPEVVEHRTGHVHAAPPAERHGRHVVGSARRFRDLVQGPRRASGHVQHGFGLLRDAHQHFQRQNAAVFTPIRERDDEVASIEIDAADQRGCNAVVHRRRGAGIHIVDIRDHAGGLKRHDLLRIRAERNHAQAVLRPDRRRDPFHVRLVLIELGRRAAAHIDDQGDINRHGVHVDELDGLRHAVVSQQEVCRRQAGDGLVPGSDGHVD
jgi:hypothetical protein